MVQIGFTEWTRDGKLRHPRYQGLREDKAANGGRARDPLSRRQIRPVYLLRMTVTSPKLEGVEATFRHLDDIEWTVVQQQRNADGTVSSVREKWPIIRPDFLVGLRALRAGNGG